MVISELEGPFKGQGAFPEGYDANGKSLYYDGRFSQKGSWLYRRPILAASPTLRFGQVEELKLHGEFLEEYIRTSFSNDEVPVYIFDDHNHALFAWCEALKEGRIEKGATLLHFDDDADISKPQKVLSGVESLAEVATYSHFIDCASFIEPALSAGLVESAYWIQSWRDGECHRMYTSERVRERGRVAFGFHGIIDDVWMSLDPKPVPKKIILDIDLDYFVPITNTFGEKREIRRLREMMLHAGVITIATSPGYISSQRAIQLAKELLKP